MGHREHALGVEVAVSNQPEDERRNDCAPGLGRIRKPYLRSARGQGGPEIAPHGDEPAAPDEELQEHHHAQPALHEVIPGIPTPPRGLRSRPTIAATSPDAGAPSPLS